MSRGKRYTCPICASTFTAPKPPTFCPFCGKPWEDVQHAKAKAYAEKCLQDCESLLPRVEAAYAAYIKVYAEYEDKRQTLRQYVKRGLFDASRIPAPVKMKMSDALKEYRANKTE